MDQETKRLIRVRAAKRARFKRAGFGTKKQLSESWRRPRGLHNKQRMHKKAKGAHPSPGYGSPVAVRGLHPSGYQDILVHNLQELEGLEPETQAVRIAGAVGMKKRELMQARAAELGLRVLNPKETAPGPAAAVDQDEEDEEVADE
ncbi:MAG: 50S ribosomal protein L32e [Methanospirillum sp.]|mgnify:FL=1|nr:50S ribosomal protein L32e [Methanospirillum sp.]